MIKASEPGRVLSPTGRGLRSKLVTLIDADNVRHTAAAARSASTPSKTSASA